MLETDKHIRDSARTAKWAIGLLCGATFIWGALVPLEGAVVSVGTVIVDGNVKKVQHPTGGIIGQLLVKEGSSVRQGDVVARLDDTQTRANLGIILGDLVAQRARLQRLQAERDDLTELHFSDELLAAAAKDASTRQAIESETKLFNARRLTRDGQKNMLRERVAQTEKEMQGTSLQLRATSEQLSIVREERQALEPLRLKGLVQKPRLTALEKEIARNEGIVGDAKSRLEQGSARIRETESQMKLVDRERIAEVNKETRETETKLVELSERRKAGEDQLQRVDIRAPAAGTVHEMNVHTVGGVINPGEPLMLIVPEPQELVIEARVAPQDIDQIHKTQPARIRFTSFNQRITPEVSGNVFRISPNTTKDQQTGATFYTVGLRLTEGQADKLKGSVLAPGMLAETFITTTDRTVLSFLFKPLTDNFIKVFAGR
jgi:HlyD family secretion protein